MHIIANIGEASLQLKVEMSFSDVITYRQVLCFLCFVTLIKTRLAFVFANHYS